MKQQTSFSKNKWHKKTLNKRGPEIEPCGKPDIVFSYALSEDPIFVFIYDSEGNLELFSKREVIVHTHVVLQLVNHYKYNEMSSISQSEVHQKLIVINCFFPFIYHQKKTMFCTKVFSKSALKFWNDFIKWFGSCSLMRFSNI